MKYRSKPCIVEAIQLTEQNIEQLLQEFSKVNLSYDYVMNFHTGLRDKKFVGVVISDEYDTFSANVNDYIVKNEFGKYNVLSPDLFNDIYEVAE